jgi:hypothetical protein
MFAASKSGQSVVAASTDPNFKYVPLLLETTSTNGQQNNTFLDSSTNNFTITRNGTPTQGSVTPYWPNGYWSNYFNGSTDYITAPSTAMSYAGSFCVEFWFNTTTTTTYACPWSDEDGSNGGTILLNNGANNGQITVYLTGGVSNFTSTSTGLNNGRWHHVALTRSGTSLRLFINGALENTATVGSGTLTTASTERIGNSYFPSRFFGGYISNFRIVVGSPVYTSAFTPSTTPLTPITNTTLLTCQANRFLDSNTQVAAKTITVAGTPKVQAFQPFSPTASYTTAAYGGSGYFNGSTDKLTSPTDAAFNLASGSWTMEGFFQFTALANYATMVMCNLSNADGFGLSLNNTSNITYYVNGTARITSGTAISLNTWYHIAASSNGTTTTLYVNGTSIGTTTTLPTSKSYPVTVGAKNNSVEYFTGYASNVRVVKGTAVYTANFTPPTTPVTAIANTSFLANFTNAGIYDAAVQNNALTVGSAQTSISQYQFPPTSMRFNGTTDYLSFASGNQFTLGTGDFTLEAWIYPTSSSGAQGVLGLADGGSTGSLVFWYNFSAGKVSLTVYNGTTANSTGSVSLNTWTYVAFSRTSGSLKIFINGTLDSTVSFADNCNKSACVVGRSYSTLNQEYFIGYIQDLRITKGLGRYNATFPAPTAAFPTR